MPDSSSLVTIIEIDAGPALQGISQFEAGAARITAASQSATGSVDKLGLSLDAAGAASARAGAQTSAMGPSTAALTREIQAQEQALQRNAAAYAAQSGMTKFAGDATSAEAALRKLGSAHDETARKLQATVTAMPAAAVGSFESRTAALSAAQAGGLTTVPFERDAATAATTIEAIVPKTLNAIHPGGELSRAERIITQTELSDPSLGINAAKIHQAEQIAAPSIIGPPAAIVKTAASTATPIAEESAIAAQLVRVTNALEAVALSLRNAQPSPAISPGGSPISATANAAATSGQPSVASTAPTGTGAAGTAAAPSLHQTAASGSPGLAAAASANATAATGAAALTAAQQTLAAATTQTTAAQGAATNTQQHLAAATGATATAAQHATAAHTALGTAAGQTVGAHNAAAGAAQNVAQATQVATGAVTAHGAAAHNARGSIREFREEISLVDAASIGALSPIEAIRFALIGLAREFGAPGIAISLVGGALLAGVALLLGRAQELDRESRSFSATIKTMGTGSEVTAQQLRTLTEEMKHTGISAEDAKKSVDAVARSQFIAPSGYKEFLETARNAAAQTNAPVPETTTKMVEAFSSGVPAALKFTEALVHLSAEEDKNFRSMDQHGESGKALAAVYRLLEERLVNYKDLQTPVTNATQELKTQVDALFNSLAEAKWVGSITRGFTAWIGLMNDAIKNMDHVKEDFSWFLQHGADVPRSAKPGAAEPHDAAYYANRYGGVGDVMGVRGDLVGPPAPSTPAPVDTIIDDAFLTGAENAGAKIADGIKSAIPSTHDATQSVDANTAAVKALTDKLGTTMPGTNLEVGGALAGLAPSAAPALSTQGAEAQRQIGSYAVGSLGFTPSQSAALVGQARQESNFNPASGLGSAHQGLFQWDTERWGQLQAWAQLNGLDPLDYRVQLQFASKEIYTKAPEFFSATSLADQTSILTKKFEAPGNYGAEIPRRLQFAQEALPTITQPGAGFGTREQREGPAPGSGIFREARPEVTGQIGPESQQNIDIQKRIALLSEEGVAHERLAEKQKLEEEARKKIPGSLTSDIERRQFVNEGLAGFDQQVTAARELVHRQNEREINDQGRIAAAAQQAGIVAEISTQQRVKAEQILRDKGGDPATVLRDVQNQEAQAAVTAARTQLAAAEPAIAGQQRLAEAALRSRDAEQQYRVTVEATAFTQDAINHLKVTGVTVSQQQAVAIEQEKEAQLRRNEAAQQGLDLAHEVQAKRDDTAALSLELSLQGQSTQQIRAQVELLRARQELEARFPNAPPQFKEQFIAAASTNIQTNVALEQAEQAQRRLEDGFRSITSTIDGDLSNSIRNALVRTPLEAGEHLKHYWDEFRAGLKQVAGEILSTFAQLALIKPLTGTLAGALGLGQTAQQLGTFGGLFTGGGALATGAGAAPQTLSGSQIALNVNGLASGSGIFSANVPGSAVFQSGNSVTVQGAAPAIAGTGEAAQATSGAAGLSADQIQAILDAQPTTGGAQSANAPLIESFLGTITSAAAAQPAASAATTASTAGAGGPGVFLIPGTDNAITGASSLAPQLVLPEAAALATGVTPSSATQPAAAATPGLVNPSNIGGAISGATALGSLLSQPGLLPSFLSGSGGAGGLFGARGIGGAINSFGASTGLFASAGTSGVNALSGAELADLGVPGASAGIFGTSATLGSALTGAGAGFGAGILLNSVLGGNQLTGTIGSGAGSLVGALIGSIVPVIGTLIGGVLGGAAGGGLGGLLGAPPPGQSAGVTVGAGGAQTFEQAGGSAANIQASNQVAGQIASFVQQVGQLTDAQGKAIGTINSGLIAVSSDNRQGITVTGGNISGGSFGQNAQNAVVQTELQIIRSLGDVSGTLKTVLDHITDPSQLQAAVQFVDVYDKLNVTSAQLTASLTGNTNTIGPFSQALTQVNSTFAQLTGQATQFGVSAAPISAALNAVTQTLNQDFKINVAEALSTAIDGGNDFIASLIKIHQQYVQNINDAQALATGVPTGVTSGFADGTMGDSGGTPPGWILVGERGPEWMFQPGGATVLPNGQQPADVPDPLGRSFADGIGAGDIAGQLPGIGSLISQSAGGPSLLDAAGGAFGISADTLSTLGEVLPIAGPILGGLLGLATGHPLQGAIGAAASLLGFALGGPIGGVIGGLVGLIGNLFGPPPSNKASGDLIDLSSGTISDFQSAGDSKADTTVRSISQAIAASSLLLQQATGGTISGAVSVQDGSRDGIKTSYAGPHGKIDAKWGSVDEAISQWDLALAHNLVGIDPALQSELAGVTDPNQLLPTIQAYAASQNPTADAGAQPAQPKSHPQLYAITQPSGGPSYVGALTTEDVAWWQGAGATLSPYAGAAPSARQGATLYQITQSGGGPSYVGDLTTADASWWQNAGATLTPYGTLPDLHPGTALYSIAQPGGGPSYLGDLAPADVTWWQNDGATVTSAPDGTPPTPRQGAALYTIDQGAGPWYIGDLTPADAQWWENAGATLTPFAATASTIAPTSAPAATPYAGPGFADGTGGTPAGWILVGERGPEWMLQSGGATVLPNGVQPGDAVNPAGRSFQSGTGDYVTLPSSATSDTAAEAAASIAASVASLGPNVTAAISSAISGTEAAQAGPVLAALGIDQLTTVIQNLTAVAPEIAQMAQNLINGGNAMPDILTQGIQALTDPLDLAIEKEKALGAERVAVATQTGQDLVKVEQLNSANIISAVVSNLSNQTALTALQYPGNTRALETIQAAPVLAGLSGQQLTALVSDIGGVAPDLASLAEQFLATGTALPDTITQALEGIVNPLELAIQQQAAQATGRNEVQQATGQNAASVAALNTASIAQAIIQQIGNPQAMLALASHGSAAGLTALQAGPAIAGLGLDQLTALINAIGTAAPNLTDMINALVNSGNALPDALTQATEAIVDSGVLAVQKAQALAFEQVQAAGPAGQNIGEAQTLGAAEVAQATAQATGTQVPFGPLPDWISQLEEAVAAPVQLAIQKEQAAGIQRVQIAETTGADLVRVQRENADAIAQIWYQATQQLTSLRNDITSGSLSGLTPADQVSASIEHFNTVLGLVQGGNTSFINELATAGQAAVQASQSAYGNGPQTASVREQVYQAISPLLVSSTGYPLSNLQAVLSGGTTGTGSGATTDMQANTTALQDLTAAITGATSNLSSAAGSNTSGSGLAKVSASSNVSTAGASAAANNNITTNPVTGQAFTGSGITAITPNFPTFPSASTLSNSLADAIASRATDADWTTINQAVKAGILNPANQPGYALVIQQAQQWAAGQAVNPSAGLTQALSDAVHGTPTLQEWALINQAVNAGILSPVAQPQYASVIRAAQVVANAQAVSLSQIPNPQTAYQTVISGLPAFAAGTESTPAGMIMVGERGAEWMHAANDNRWSQVGIHGPELIDQTGGATILPFPVVPSRTFADGTPGWTAAAAYSPGTSGSSSDDAAAAVRDLEKKLSEMTAAMTAEIQALRKQVLGGQINADQNAKTQHALTQKTNEYVGPNISAPARRAVG